MCMGFFDRFKRGNKRRKPTYLEMKGELTQKVRTHLRREKRATHATTLLASDTVFACTEMITKAIDLRSNYHILAQLLEDIKTIEAELEEASKPFNLEDKRRIRAERERLHEEKLRLAAKIASFHKKHGELKEYIEMLKHLHDLEQQLFERLGLEGRELDHTVHDLDRLLNTK